MSNKNKNKSGIVYSTNPMFTINSLQEDTETLPPNLQKLYLRREVRNGKPCIVIKDFVGNIDGFKQLERNIKSHCGVGGSAKDGDIIIQGDLHTKIKLYLENLGFKTKG